MPYSDPETLHGFTLEKQSEVTNADIVHAIALLLICQLSFQKSYRYCTFYKYNKKNNKLHVC